MLLPCSCCCCCWCRRWRDATWWWWLLSTNWRRWAASEPALRTYRELFSRTGYGPYSASQFSPPDEHSMPTVDMLLSLSSPSPETYSTLLEVTMTTPALSFPTRVYIRSSAIIEKQRNAPGYLDIFYVQKLLTSANCGITNVCCLHARLNKFLVFTHLKRSKR